MKKVFRRNSCFLFVLCFLSYLGSAMPARPRVLQEKKEDGTAIEYILKGDENLKWAENTEGYTLLRNAEGEWEYASLNTDNQLVLSGIHAKYSPPEGLPKHLRFSQVQMEAAQRIKKITQNIERAQKEGDTQIIKAPIILVAYQDVPFTYKKEDFEMLLNQVNYNLEGAYGSVYDYFLDNSLGKMKFLCDVYGPYTLSENRKFYGENDASGEDKRPREMIMEAVDSAFNNGCDFSKYYTQNNTLSNLHIIFAGEGEESNDVADEIWSHAWNLQNPLQRNGIEIYKYSCSPEILDVGTFMKPHLQISTVGVIVHELSHVLFRSRL